MDNIVVIESSSDSDYSDSHSDHDEREEVQYENTHFMNHVETEEYIIFFGHPVKHNPQYIHPSL